ncbi:MAG: helix-turn-helix transcriptional regulator [Verrucomicrobiota bacterium]
MAYLYHSAKRDARGKIQSQDGGSILRFLFPFQPVAANQKHRGTLGETIRSYRKTAGLSQEKLAERADLHHNYIGELERGEKAATVDTLLKIARALNVRVRDLVNEL